MPSPEECRKKFKEGSLQYKQCVAYVKVSKKGKKASKQTGVSPSGAPNRRGYGGF